MAELKITDLVDPQTLEDLRTLKDLIKAAQDKYSEAAKELSKGLKMKIEGLEDLEKMSKIMEDSQKKSDEATKEYNDAMEKRKKITEKTTNTISEHLAAIEKENKAKRESYVQNKKALDIAHNILGAQKDNFRMLAKLNAELKENSEAQKKLNKAEEEGTISAKELVSQRSGLLAKEKELKTAKAELNKVISNEEKMNQAAEGSYKKLSLQLELLKKAYKELNEVEKNGAEGKTLSDEISRLDVHLKDLAADMGEFQRNVGNYAIAQSGYAESVQDKLFGLVGISSDTGKSLMEMGKSGSAGFGQLKIAASSFFKSMMVFLANPAVLAVLGIGGTVIAFKWLYDYNKGLSKATNLTQQFTGASGDLLKQQRNEVQALADSYDKDFRDVLESVNAVAQQFGISFDEAFGYVQKGFVSGADANEQFLDNLKEYPAYFKEAGLSASEFIAITTQTNKMGIYSDKAIDTIKEGNIKLREMNQATQDALEGIGISSKQVMKDLEDGSKTTFEVMQMVSEKLGEFPESSAAVGAALADIFGGPGEDAGLQYIKLLKMIETDQDKVKEKAGLMAELQTEQLKAQIEMQNALSTLFDFTGGSFEEVTIKAKIFVKEGITRLINGVISLSNYFIDLYNKSKGFRRLWQGFVLEFKTGISIVANLFNKLKDNVQALGTILKGAFTLDFKLMQKGLMDYAKSYKRFADAMVSDAQKNLQKAQEGVNMKVGPIKLIGSDKKEGEKDDKKETDKKGNAKKGKTVKEVAEDAKERKKIIEALQQSEIELMDEGYQKGLELMKANHEKRLSEIKGNSAEEQELRKNLTLQYQKKLAEYDKAYNEAREKQDIQNRLEVVKEGSDEELSLRLRLLDLEEKAELRAAEKTGADGAAIESKYNDKREKLQEELSAKRISILQEEYSVRAVMANVAYTNELTELKKLYAEGLVTKEEYEERKRELSSKYATSTIENSIGMLQAQLDTENLSADERERIEVELAKSKAELEAKMADDMVSQTERQDAADEKAAENRKARLRDIVNTSMEAFSAITDLMNTKYDREIEDLDKMSERNQEEHDAELERIHSLEEAGILSKEEAEQRKIAAEQKSKAKEEQLMKQKQKIQQKQAAWNKANQVAQSIINTARAVTEALPNIILASIIGGIGAAQTAMIISTPIPQYAKGTDFHKGGMAVVGDGGKKEVVITNEGMWLTPDSPTLVDLPKGAKVLPDAEKISKDFGDIIRMEQGRKFQQTINNGNNTTTSVLVDNKKMEAGIRRIGDIAETQTKILKKAEKASRKAEFRKYMQN